MVSAVVSVDAVLTITFHPHSHQVLGHKKRLIVRPYLVILELAYTK